MDDETRDRLEAIEQRVADGLVALERSVAESVYRLDRDDEETDRNVSDLQDKIHNLDVRLSRVED